MRISYGRVRGSGYNAQYAQRSQKGLTATKKKKKKKINKYKNPGEKGYRVSERHANKLVLVVPVDEQSINENANAKEQVPSAQDQMGGEDVSGQEVRDQSGNEDELTSQEKPAHPEADPDDAAVGAASDTKSEQDSLADSDHYMRGSIHLVGWPRAP